MRTHFRDVAHALIAILAVLLFVRDRVRRKRVPASAPDRVEQAVDSVQKVHRSWAIVQGAVILAVVLFLAFFGSLIANILSVTVIVMVLIWLWAQPKVQEEGIIHRNNRRLATRLVAPADGRTARVRRSAHDPSGCVR